VQLSLSSFYSTSAVTDTSVPHILVRFQNVVNAFSAQRQENTLVKDPNGEGSNIMPSLRSLRFIIGMLLLIVFSAVLFTSNAQSTWIELLTEPWHLTPNNGDDQRYQEIDSNVLMGRDTLCLTYNLHGNTMLGNDASAIIFDQNNDWRYISLSNYGQNGLNGSQSVEIPLSHFPNLNLNQPVGTFHARFWSQNQIVVDITSAVVYNSQTSGYTCGLIGLPTNPPTTIPLPTSGTPGGLLSQTWHLTPNNGDQQLYQEIDPNALNGKDILRVVYDLHGHTILGNDASAIIFDQNNDWRYISLSNYGQNGFNGTQTVDIPLSHFPGLDPNQPVGTLHTRFWSAGPIDVHIYSITALSSQPPTATSTPMPIVTSTPTPIPPLLSPAEYPGTLLAQPIRFVTENGSQEIEVQLSAYALSGRDKVRLAFNTYGSQLVGNDASAIVFDQLGWKFVPLANYGINGYDGVQTVEIPLSDFAGLNPNQPVSTLRFRFWSQGLQTVDIYAVVPFSASGIEPAVAGVSTPVATPYPPCPGGTGPGNIVAGDYPPTRLTQDERQWLFNVFGEAGTAPVGFGGRRCGNSYADSFQNFVAMVCSRGDIGPNNRRAGSYPPTSLTQEERQWLFELFRNQGTAPVGYGGERCPNQNDDYTVEDIQIMGVCGSGAVGPYGMVPGAYNATELMQDERQWLYQIFGNSGTAPTGYGGPRCPGQINNYPPPNRTKPYNPAPRACPSGVGAPGTFPPLDLTQQQRNELYNAFGHAGTAPVGYGGEHCYGGQMTLPSFTNGSNPVSTPPPGPNSGGTCNLGGSNLATFAGSSIMPSQQSEYVQVNLNSVRFREQANPCSNVKGFLTKGHYYKLIGRSNGWGNIAAGNQLGWVYLAEVTEINNVSSAIDIAFQYFGAIYNYKIVVANSMCYIMNGSEIIAQELSRFQNAYLNSGESEEFYVHYFAPDEAKPLFRAEIDTFRISLESTLTARTGCTRYYYYVVAEGLNSSGLGMDTSGLGNIVFGYFMSKENIAYEDYIADKDQWLSSAISEWKWQEHDYPDDVIQRRVGRMIADLTASSASPSPVLVEQVARDLGLF
jgi:hypothetical protein